MRNIIIYLKPICYNAIHHKIYSLFCIGGTMLTFIFITILLQIANVIVGNMPPIIQSEQIISIPKVLEDENGNPGKWINRGDIQTIVSHLQGMECYTCYHVENIDIKVSGRTSDYGVYFIDKDYWNVFQFNFIEGHPFSENDMQMPCVIVNENFVRRFFLKGDVIGKEIQFQRGTFKISGVVAEVSFFAQEGEASLWVPEKFNKYIPSGNDCVSAYIRFPKNMDEESCVKRVKSAFNSFTNIHFNFEGSTTLKGINSVKYLLEKKYGGDLFMFGVLGIIFILLIIPILNFILLSIANTSTQIGEIGLRRALGSNKRNVFLFILLENFFLIILGTVLGVIMTIPVCEGINYWLFSDNIVGQTTMLTGLEWNVILTRVLPLSFLFSFLSGGIPAYLMIKQPIMVMLKGGSKC